MTALRGVVERAAICVPGETRLFHHDHVVLKETEVVETQNASSGCVSYLDFYSAPGFDLPLDKESYEDDNVRMLLAHGYIVEMFSATRKHGLKLMGAFTDFKHPVLCARARPDGKLIGVSDAGGTIKLFQGDTHKRRTLRRLKMHNEAVRRFAFTKGSTTLVSAGDDLVAYLWDLTSETPIATFENIHKDSVTVTETAPLTHATYTPNEFMTGSRDGWVKIWDQRTQSAVHCIEHVSQPVGAAAFFHSGPNIVTTFASTVTVWDSRMLSSSKRSKIKTSWDTRSKGLVTSRIHHLGTITDLKVAKNDSAYITSSLDHTVKVVDVANNYKIQRSFRMNGAVASAAMSSSGYFVAGQENGTYTLWRNTPSTEESSSTELRGWDAVVPRKSDQVISIASDTHKRRQQSVFPDHVIKALDHYEYQKLIDSSLMDTDERLFSMICGELAARCALEVALRGKDIEGCKEYLKYFTSKLYHLKDPIIIHAFETMLEQNGAFMAQEGDEELLRLLAEAHFSISKTIAVSAAGCEILPTVISRLKNLQTSISNH